MPGLAGHPQLPLKDALRGLRHIARSGRTRIGEMASHGPLPKRAVAVLARLDGMAQNAETLASGLARRVLGGAPPPHLSLAEIAAGADAPACFAAAAYAGLRMALARLGAPDALVSEAVAHGAYLDASHAGDEASRAAALAVALEDRGAVLALGHPVDPAIDLSMLEPVAIFATLLWLLAPRNAADALPALEAAVAIAAALEGELAQARRDPARLKALFAEFRDHV